jgi:hypothetical protein
LEILPVGKAEISSLFPGVNRAIALYGLGKIVPKILKNRKLQDNSSNEKIFNLHNGKPSNSPNHLEWIRGSPQPLKIRLIII